MLQHVFSRERGIFFAAYFAPDLLLVPIRLQAWACKAGNKGSKCPELWYKFFAQAWMVILIELSVDFPEDKSTGLE